MSQSFGSQTTSPFQAAGDNVFSQMQNGNNSGNKQDMSAPNMNDNGMPQGSNPTPQSNQQSNPQGNSGWGAKQGTPNGDGGGQQQSNQSNQQQSQQEGGSPLDNFAPKVDNSTNKQQQQQAPQQQQGSVFDTDLKGWENATSKIDLTTGIEPEKVQAALGGDANEFMAIIAQVSRNAMTNAAFMSTKASGHGVNSSMEQFGTRVPGMINDHQFNTMWKGDSVMSHPTAQPMVTALTQQFRQNDPNASTEDVSAKVKEYMETFMGEMTGSNNQQAPSENEPSAGNVSLTDFFNS